LCGYTQSNLVKQYQLEIDIRASKQNDLSIQEFYSVMTTLCDQPSLTELAKLSIFASYITRRESQHLVQFLIVLRSNSGNLHGSILYRNPLPFILFYFKSLCGSIFKI